MVVVYLDTWMLRLAASKRLGDRKIAAQMFARLESGVYEVKVPQTAMGEAAATVMRDFDEGEWKEVYGRIMEMVGRVADPSTCLPPPGPEEAEAARRILGKIPRLGMTDALIVAQALLDPKSQKMVTVDTLITTSHWLAEEERRMRQDGRRTEHLRFERRV